VDRGIPQVLRVLLMRRSGLLFFECYCGFQETSRMHQWGLPLFCGKFSV
jgi:hypothetical protein